MPCICQSLKRRGGKRRGAGKNNFHGEILLRSLPKFLRQSNDLTAHLRREKHLRIGRGKFSYLLHYIFGHCHSGTGITWKMSDAIPVHIGSAAWSATEPPTEHLERISFA